MPVVKFSRCTVGEWNQGRADYRWPDKPYAKATSWPGFVTTQSRLLGLRNNRNALN
jgi:hypothetical protein